MAKGVYQTGRRGAVSRQVRSTEFTTGATNAGVMELKKRSIDCIIHGNAIIKHRSTRVPTSAEAPYLYSRTDRWSRRCTARGARGDRCATVRAAR